MILAALMLALPAPCPAPVVDVSTWPEHEGHVYSFRLPPGFTRLRKSPDAGDDEWTMQDYTTDGSKDVVSLTFGPYAGKLVQKPGVGEYASCWETISGHEARIITARDPDGWYVAGATWGDVGSGQRLTLVGRTHDLAVLQQMLAAFRTVRIKARS